MSTVLDAIESHGTPEKFLQVTKRLVGAQSDVRWCYNLSSSKYFPFRYYASAVRGAGPDADEVLVISIECFDSHDEKRELLIISADITGEDGVLLAESPKIEIGVPPESAVQRDPDGIIARVKEQIESATEVIVHWIDSQRATIERALAPA
ncbi:MAG: hypothetical protein ACR2JC_06035 [Chloroflexota bacterium]|nr:MAG: hypothetical protein DLM70_03715 [Chloroflexota bacterium]